MYNQLIPNQIMVEIMYQLSILSDKTLHNSSVHFQHLWQTRLSNKFHITKTNDHMHTQNFKNICNKDAELQFAIERKSEMTGMHCMVKEKKDINILVRLERIFVDFFSSCLNLGNLELEGAGVGKNCYFLLYCILNGIMEKGKILYKL